jgi:hypothetical protein
MGGVQRFGEKRAFRRINGAVMPVGSPRLELEMATATGLNCQRVRPGEYTALGKLAEGEELGSNLLHVGQRTPAGSGGSGSWQKRA